MLFLLQTTWYGPVTHAYKSAKYTLQKISAEILILGHTGHSNEKVIFTKKCYFSYRWHGMVLWLMHIHQLDAPYESYLLKFKCGVIWGHRGQKVIFTKNVFSPTYYMVWSCDSRILIS